MQSRHPECSASQRLSLYVTWEAASRVNLVVTGAYMAETAYLVGCCERQCLVAVLFWSQCDDYFCVSVCNYDFVCQCCFDKSIGL